jgi:hypothetical protein
VIRLRTVLGAENGPGGGSLRPASFTGTALDPETGRGAIDGTTD